MITSRARMLGRSMRSRPRRPDATGWNMACNCSESTSRSLQRARNCSPSGVTRTLRVVRCSNRVPRLASSCCTAVDTRAFASPSFASFAETTEEQFDLLANVHLKGTFFLTQKLLPLIADGGRIVNTSSGLTRFSYPGASAYAAMKGGVEVLTRYLAKELGPRGIAVNTVAPGAIETDFGGGTVRDNAQLNAMIASQTALGRVGVADDIGGAVAALLTDGNRWVNGQRIGVSGGVNL